MTTPRISTLARGAGKRRARPGWQIADCLDRGSRSSPRRAASTGATATWRYQPTQKDSNLVGAAVISTHKLHFHAPRSPPCFKSKIEKPLGRHRDHVAAIHRVMVHIHADE